MAAVPLAACRHRPGARHHPRAPAPAVPGPPRDERARITRLDLFVEQRLRRQLRRQPRLRRADAGERPADDPAGRRRIRSITSSSIPSAPPANLLGPLTLKIRRTGATDFRSLPGRRSAARPTWSSPSPRRDRPTSPPVRRSAVIVDVDRRRTATPTRSSSSGRGPRARTTAAATSTCSSSGRSRRRRGSAIVRFEKPCASSPSRSTCTCSPPTSWPSARRSRTRTSTRSSRPSRVRLPAAVEKVDWTNHLPAPGRATIESLVGT